MPALRLRYSTASKPCTRYSICSKLNIERISMSADNLDRRRFLKQAGGIGTGVALASKGLAKSAAKLNPSRVIGANDRINIGLIGCGGRGSSDARSFTKFAETNNNACQIVAVCDPYEKRKRTEAEIYKAKGFTDYREVLAMPD